MPFLEVTSTTNAVKVTMGDYFGTALEVSEGIWRKENIGFQKLENCIEANIEGEKTWHVSFDGWQSDDGSIKSLKVDKVNNTNITSNDVLFTKLSEMLE